jgi:hypothetical protein
MTLQIGNYIQIGLLVVYAVLTGVFVKEKQYLPALYYAGCIVKDLGVFLLTVLK